jgi:putative transposase
MRRPRPIEHQSTQHIYTKSIYKFKIFTCRAEFQRMLQLIWFYQFDSANLRYSNFLERSDVKKEGFSKIFAEESKNKTKLVHVIAYCLIPSHLHLILEQNHENGITTFMRRLLNAYTRYFNLRHNRRGPLWEHRFGNTPIEDDIHFQIALNYVLHNPVKHCIVNHPSQWKYSSYNPPHSGSAESYFLHSGGGGGHYWNARELVQK